jgi:uncharacterized protein
MYNLTEEMLLNEIIKQNSWWVDPSNLAEDPGKHKRNLFESLYPKVSKSELITAVTGLRRIGKTTLLKQVVNKLLEIGTSSRNILYFSFDEYTLSNYPEIIVSLIEYQLKKKPKEQLYFLFDEIQYVASWNAVLKKYTDIYPNIKLVISGSSSLFIKTEAKESLAGRIQEFMMYPLSYGEYLRIQNIINLPLTGLKNPDILLPYNSILVNNFYEYLLTGEFPYLSKLTSFSEKRDYVLDWVIGKILEFDLPKIQRIVNSASLTNLGSVIIEGSGQIVELTNLANDLEITRATLYTYLELLEKSHIAGQLMNMAAGYRSRKVRIRKVYASSVNAVVLKNTTGVSSESFMLKTGQIIETFVYNYLSRMGYETYLYREREGKEVDFIIKTETGFIPVEVKYQNRINHQDLKNILYYCKKKGVREAYVITKMLHETKSIEGVKIRFLPAYFLT